MASIGSIFIGVILIERLRFILSHRMTIHSEPQLRALIDINYFLQRRAILHDMIRDDYSWAFHHKGQPLRTVAVEVYDSLVPLTGPDPHHEREAEKHYQKRRRTSW